LRKNKSADVDGIVWEKPGPSYKGGNGRRQRMIAVMKKHPGKWALWNETTRERSTTGIYLYRSKYGLEFAMRSQGNGKMKVYARVPPRKVGRITVRLKPQFRNLKAKRGKSK
jgi:hypothetical protein